MNDSRINREDFSSALARLREGAAEDPGRTGLVVDGVIQRFGFTFEQAWKLLQTILRHQGFDCRRPRACIKQAYQAGVLADGDGRIRRGGGIEESSEAVGSRHCHPEQRPHKSLAAGKEKSHPAILPGLMVKREIVVSPDEADLILRIVSQNNSVFCTATGFIARPKASVDKDIIRELRSTVLSFHR